MGKLLAIIIVLLAVLLVWGLIGGAQADDIGYTCDFGIGDGNTLCWSWSKNVIGELQDGLKLVGKTIEEGIQKLN